MPVGDFGTRCTGAGRVAVLGTSETYLRYTIGVVAGTSSSILLCDIRATPCGLSYLYKPAMGRSAAGCAKG